MRLYRGGKWGTQSQFVQCTSLCFNLACISIGFASKGNYSWSKLLNHGALLTMETTFAVTNWTVWNARPEESNCFGRCPGDGPGFFASPMRRYILTQMFQGRERRIIPRNLQITIGVRKKGFRRLTNLFSHCGVVGSWNRLQSWVGVSGYSRNWGKCNETTIGNMVWIPWEHMHSKPYFTHWKKPWMLVCIPNVNLPWENGNVLLSHDPLFDLAVL